MRHRQGDDFVALPPSAAPVPEALRLAGPIAQPVAATARRADVSRPTAYQALADLRSLGLSAREGRRHLAVLHAGRRSVPAAHVRAFEGDDGLRDAWATLVRGLPRGATI